MDVSGRIVEKGYLLKFNTIINNCIELFQAFKVTICLYKYRLLLESKALRCFRNLRNVT